MGRTIRATHLCDVTSGLYCRGLGANRSLVRLYAGSAVRVAPHRLHRVALLPELLVLDVRPRADVADFAVREVVPAAAGFRVGDRFAVLVTFDDRHALVGSALILGRTLEVVGAARAAGVGHVRQVRVRNDVAVVARAVIGTPLRAEAGRVA